MSRNTIILIVLGLLVLGVAGYLLFGKPNPEDGLEAVSDTTSAAELTFLTLAAQIDSVSFDTSVLQDPRFMLLQDIRTAILPEPSGRPDPFAPLGAPAR